MAVANDGTH